MEKSIEWVLIGMLGSTIIFFVRDWFLKSATKSEVKTIRDKAEESYKLATEAITAQNEIKFNYLDRFNEIQSTMNNNHVETISKIGELSTNLNRDFVQKKDCPFIHQNKT